MRLYDLLRFESELEELPGVTLEQAQSLLNLSESKTLRILRRLEQEKRIVRERFSVRPVPELRGPLWSSTSGAIFNATKIESRIRGRYGKAELVDVWSIDGVARPLQIDHEMGVSAVRLWYAQNRPGWKWVGERPRRGALVPDALATGPEGGVIIEFAGEYRSPALREIVRHYQNQVPLELW